MSTLTLTLADFRAQVPLSDKIEDSQIRSFIQDTYTLDLVPLLDYPLLDAVGALTVPTLVEYAPLAAYTVGQFVARRERIYQAVVDTTGVSIPTGPASTSEWTYEPLLTLWTQYLKPFYARAAYSRFLPWHGRNITKAGITVPTDRQNGTYDRPTSSERAELTASVDSTADALRSRLTRFMHSESQAYQKNAATGYNYFPTTSCATPMRPAATRLRGINTRRN